MPFAPVAHLHVWPWYRLGMLHVCTVCGVLMPWRAHSLDHAYWLRDLLCIFKKAVWSSGLGHWIWNLEVPSLNPPPYCYLNLFLVVLSSTPWPHYVNINNQMVSLPPVGILNNNIYVVFGIFVCLFTVSSISITVLLKLSTGRGGGYSL